MFTATGRTVLMLLRATGTARYTEIEIELEWAAIWTVRGGKVLTAPGATWTGPRPSKPPGCRSRRCRRRTSRSTSGRSMPTTAAIWTQLLDEFDPGCRVALGVEWVWGPRSIGARRASAKCSETWTRTSRAWSLSSLRFATSETGSLALGRLRARGHESGVQAEGSFNPARRLQERQVIRIRSFLDRQEALEAAGLSE